MSKPRHDWWPYVKGMIRRYPALREQFLDLHEQSITPAYSAMPGGGGVSRTVEQLALKTMPKIAQKEYDAVLSAIEETQRMKTGADRIKVIDLVFWKHSHTLEGAAQSVPCHYKTAQEYHREFIYLVAEKFGFLE